MTKVKPIEQEFLQDLTHAIERLDKPRKPSTKYKPSSLGGCMRNMFFMVTGVEPTVEKRTYTNIGITETGTDRHEHLQKALSKMQKLGYDCEWISVSDYIKKVEPAGTKVTKDMGYETKCYNSILDMNFLADGVVKYKGVYYLIEIKTETLFKWQGQTQPYQKHIKQASAYGLCLGIDKVFFIYENRDNSDKKVFKLDITTAMKEEVIAEVEECNGFVERQEVPPKDTAGNNCTYCKYKAECKRWG